MTARLRASARIGALAMMMGLRAWAPAPVEAQAPDRPSVPAAPSQAAPLTAAIRGRVTAADSPSGVHQARVVLKLATGDESVASTDAEGRYEFKRLAAGRYTVSVSKRPFVTVEYGQRGPREPGRPITLRDGEVRDKVDVTLPRACVVAGTVFDELGEPAEHVRVAAMRLERVNGVRRLVAARAAVRTNDLGRYRIYGLTPGTYYIGTPPPIADALPRPVAGRAFKASYYPGASNLAQALPVALEVGQQRLDLDFRLVEGRPVRLSGRVSGTRGGSFTIQAMQASGHGGGFIAASTGVQADGTFGLENVAPGDYTLVASGTEASSSMQLTGSVSLVVGERDIENIVIPLSLPITISGVIRMQAGGAQAATQRTTARVPDLLATMRVYPEPAADSPPSTSLTSTTNFAGRFEIRNVAPGRMTFRVTGVPSGWTVESITYMGLDVLDAPAQIRGNASMLEVVITDRVSEVSGAVTDASGRPARDYLVIVFPESARLRDRPRYLATARPDQDGRYVVRGLPPRVAYLVLAVERAAADDPFDPEYLENQRLSTTHLILGRGESKTLDLKLAAQ